MCIGLNCQITKSTIGRYVSIANNVSIGIGNHKLDKISTSSLFYSNAFSVHLTHETTTGYYNNQETNPFRKLGMNLLENTFHTQDTVLEMCKRERLRSGIYVILWIGVLASLKIDLEWPLVVAQSLFSEQLVSRWLRLEWLRMEVERVKDRLLSLFRGAPDEQRQIAMILEQMTNYDTANARAGVTLSSTIFNRRNTNVSKEWVKAKCTLWQGAKPQ